MSYSADIASATGISKSGLYAHFGSKQELQLATIDEAQGILTSEVLRPALAPGLPQLLAACEAFFDYVQHAFPGGCFFAATAMEMGARPGPVRDRIAMIQSSFTTQLREWVAAGHELRESAASLLRCSSSRCP